MRELFKALSELETRLMEQYGVSLNEAMALCCIGGDTLTASVISENTGLSASHTSKVIRSIEEKELIVRNLGDKINGRCILLYPIKGVNVWKR